MSEKLEIAIAKAVTVIFIILLLGMIFRGEQANGVTTEQEIQIKVMGNLFIHYNHKLSTFQAHQIAELVIQAGEKYQVAPFVLAAIIVRESSARPWVISKGGDYGLMQVRWRVHQKQIKKKYPQVRGANDLLAPEVNVFVGAEIFAGYCARTSTLRGGLLRYSTVNKTLANRVLKTLNALRESYRKEVANER